jgi:hypothetical protein
MSITLKTAMVYGLAWLYEIEQPPGAVVPPHGIEFELPEIRRTLRFVPRGTSDQPTVVLAVMHPRWRDGQCLNPLDREEQHALAAWCVRIHHRIRTPDPVNPGDSACLVLERHPHPSLCAAVRRYEDGCPDHGGAIRGCGCPWLSCGLDQVRYPYRFDTVQEI